MKIVELKNVKKKEIPLYYRREYSGTFVYKGPSDSTVEKNLLFSVETRATGLPEVKINILDDIEYPLLPTIKSLKTFILHLDKDGKLL